MEKKPLVLIDMSGTVEGIIAIGPKIVANGGAICFSNERISLTISQEGSNCSSERTIGILKELFFEGNEHSGLLVKTSCASLRIDKDGSVFINDKKVGSDPELLAGAVAFILGQFAATFPVLKGSGSS